MDGNEEYNVRLNNFERRVIVRGLADIREIRKADNKPVEDLDDVILKLIDAPKAKKRWRERDEER